MPNHLKFPEFGGFRGPGFVSLTNIFGVSFVRQATPYPTISQIILAISLALSLKLIQPLILIS